jgi:hypothetical protein
VLASILPIVVFPAALAPTKKIVLFIFGPLRFADYKIC